MQSSQQLPPRIAKHLLANGQLMEEKDIEEIKAAIQKISALQIKKLPTNITEEERKKLIEVITFRYYGKKELSKFLNRKIPYGVEYAKLQLENEARNVMFFKLPGEQGKIWDVEKDFKKLGDPEFTETSLVNKGGNGKIVFLHNIDAKDSTLPFIVAKIKNYYLHDDEFKHAAKAKLAIGASFRKSPSHNNKWQQRLYMYFVPGIDLNAYFEKLFNSPHSHSPLKLLAIYQNIFLAVKEASHQFGAIHRDIKLDNFHITDEVTLKMKLLDFGFQKTLIKEELVDDKGIGADPYRAPEVINEGRYSVQSDLYALGELMKKIHHAEKWFTYLFPNEKVRQYLGAFVDILTDEKSEQRPESIDDCEKFLKTLSNFARAIEYKSDTTLHQIALDSQLEYLKKPIFERIFDACLFEEVFNARTTKC